MKLLESYHPEVDCAVVDYDQYETKMEGELRQYTLFDDRAYQKVREDEIDQAPSPAKKTRSKQILACRCSLKSKSKDGSAYSCTVGQSPAKEKKCECAERGEKCGAECVCYCNNTHLAFGY